MQFLSYPHSYLFLCVSILFLAAGCSGDDTADAYGQFEATETTISARMAGELLAFGAREGEALDAGQQAGLIDTTQLQLQKEELQSQLEATRSQIANIDAEAAVRRQELQTARTNLERTQRMVEDRAATPQQLDDIQGRVQTLEKQIDALQTQKGSVRAQISATQARIRQTEQRLDDSRLINPVRGTVITTYAEPHELVGQGQPLYRIANLDTLELRVYVSGAQLPAITLGQQVEVLADRSTEENQRFTGRISWIASEAEFTPKMIQTKEERVTQVYAVKVKVPNPDGVLKIGMPGEVNFKTEGETE